MRIVDVKEVGRIPMQGAFGKWCKRCKCLRSSRQQNVFLCSALTL